MPRSAVSSLVVVALGSILGVSELGAQVTSAGKASGDVVLNAHLAEADVNKPIGLVDRETRKVLSDLGFVVVDDSRTETATMVAFDARADSRLVTIELYRVTPNVTKLRVTSVRASQSRNSTLTFDTSLALAIARQIKASLL